MCIAILNNNETLSLDTIKNSFDNNRDGASFTYIENNSLKVYKELDVKNVDTFYQNYTKIREFNSLPIMLHFRIGTSGIKDKRNLHPFFVNQNLALVHNGIIDITNINKDYNDTYHFAKLCRQFKSHDKFLKSDSLEFKLIQDLIGTNKIIYLSNQGAYSIMNESLGHWDKSGNWYSNKTYEACNYFDVGGRKTYKYDSYFDKDYDFGDVTRKVNGQFKLDSQFDYCLYNDSYHIKNFGWFQDLGYYEKCNLIQDALGIKSSITTFGSYSQINALHEEYGTTNLYDLYIEVCYYSGIIQHSEESELFNEK